MSESGPVAIMGIVWQSARAVLTRSLDGVEPKVTAEIPAALQLIVVIVSNSVALLADTIHNIAGCGGRAHRLQPMNGSMRGAR